MAIAKKKVFVQLRLAWLLLIGNKSFSLEYVEHQHLPGPLCRVVARDALASPIFWEIVLN